ncbi:hypothetical protein Bca4012_082845 [Brassica carinata]
MPSLLHPPGTREELYIPGPRMMVATPRASTNKRNGSCKGIDKAVIALARLFMARLAGNENKRKNPTGNKYFELFFMEFFQLSRKIGFEFRWTSLERVQHILSEGRKKRKTSKGLEIEQRRDLALLFQVPAHQQIYSFMTDRKHRSE